MARCGPCLLPWEGQAFPAVSWIPWIPWTGLGRPHGHGSEADVGLAGWLQVLRWQQHVLQAATLQHMTMLRAMDCFSEGIMLCDPSQPGWPILYW